MKTIFQHKQNGQLVQKKIKLRTHLFSTNLTFWSIWISNINTTHTLLFFRDDQTKINSNLLASIPRESETRIFHAENPQKTRKKTSHVQRGNINASKKMTSDKSHPRNGSWTDIMANSNIGPLRHNGTSPATFAGRY